MASYIYWEIKGEFDLTSYDLYLSDSVTTLNNYIFSGSDSVYGSTLDDYIDLPDYGVDNIFADNGNDFIVTNYGLDSGNVSGYVSGGAGNDLIWSHGKKDILEGDNGSDIFEFNATNSNTAIFDFEPEVDALNIIISDKMNGLSSKLSTGYLDNGEQYFYLTENQIYAKPGAKKAKDYDDLIVYNTKTGVVFFDSDGKGGSVPVKIVQLIGSPDLDAEDLAKIITLGISGHDSSDTIDNYWFSTYGMPGSY